MSRKPEKPSTKNELRRLRRRTFHKSPCGRPPNTPDGLAGSFVRKTKARHNRIIAKVRWTEVHEDTSDVRILIRHYKLELEYTPNGSDWFLDRRATVSAKDDNDPGDKDHHIFTNVQKDLGYRYRVRAIARDGCKSAWSDYFVLGNPGTDEPPAPTAVRIFDRDNVMRVDLVWSGLESDDDNDLFDDRINHYVAEISKQSNFSTTYAKNRGVKGDRASFKIHQDDEDDTFYGRVRSVSADKDKSAWIPATLAGNSDPEAAPSGVSVGRAMQKTKAPKAPTGVTVTFDNTEARRGAKWRAKVSWSEVVADVSDNDVDIDKYVILWQKSNNGSVWTDDPRRVVVNAKDGDADTTAYRIFHNIREKLFYRARVRAVSETNTRGAFSAYTSAQQPSTSTPAAPVNVTVHQRARPKDRVVVDWDVPTQSGDTDLADESIAYFQTIVKRNSNTSPTFGSAYRSDKYVAASQRTFRINKAHVEDSFSAWVRSVDVDGNKSAWIPATTGGNSSSGATASSVQTSDGVKPGTIRKLSHASAGADYVLANGASYSTSAYPDLFAEIGYLYGGSGSTFVVPDLRRRTSRGVGSGQSLGQADKANNVAGTAEASRVEVHDDISVLPGTSAHQHNIPSGQETDGPSSTRTVGSGTAVTIPGTAHKHSTTSSWNTNTSGGHSHNNSGGDSTSPKIRLHYYVKAEE